MLNLNIMTLILLPTMNTVVVNTCMHNGTSNTLTTHQTAARATNSAIPHLLIYAPLFENNFLISMTVSSSFEVCFFLPWTIQPPAIYNQCLCRLDAYNKHLNANLCGLYKRVTTLSVPTSSTCSSLLPKWFPVTSVFK